MATILVWTHLVLLISFNFVYRTNLVSITKTYLYNFDPLKPHFYTVIVLYSYTWGGGYTLFFLFLLKNIGCGYSLEPPLRGGFNKDPQSMFWAEIWKLSEFLSENFQFLVLKFSIYLNWGVFVMSSKIIYFFPWPNDTVSIFVILPIWVMQHDLRSRIIGLVNQLKSN